MNSEVKAPFSSGSLLDITTNLMLIALLIVLTAFFVGAEFAVVKVRMSRIDQLIAEGNKKAVVAKKLAGNLDYYLSACQLGITVTALGLGFLGEPTVERILHPLFGNTGMPEALSSFISLVLALSIMTYLHVVLGELAPKTLAIQYTEQITLLLAVPLYWFGRIMKPFIWTLNGSARVLLRIFGVKPTHAEVAYSEDELKIIMSNSFQGGEINQTELSYLKNIFTFDERVTKDIMVPRTQMVTLSQSMDTPEILSILDKHQYTRYPIIGDGDKDHVIGYVNVKQMLTDNAVGRRKPLQESLQEMPYVNESTPLQDTLLKMQKERVHIALVIDEFGGTAGIITMEDILEEIVGDIHDEFDADEVPDVEQKSEDLYYLNGRVLLSDLEARFGLTFEEIEEVDTIGGWVQLKNIDVSVNDSIEHEGTLWTVLEMDNHQILKISMQLNASEAE